MLMNRVLVSVNRTTGEETRTHLGYKEVDDNLVAEAYVNLITGMSLEDCCKEIRRLKNEEGEAKDGCPSEEPKAG